MAASYDCACCGCERRLGVQSSFIRSRCIPYCAGAPRGIQHTRQRKQALALRAGFSTLALEERCRGAGRCRGRRVCWPLIDVALRAAAALKDRICCIYLMSSRWQKTFICLDLSIRSMLKLLVLKNAAECTSQRLKRTSGARVMITVHA